MANEYLKRTPTSTGNRKVFTWSGWVKTNLDNGPTNGNAIFMCASANNGSAYHRTRVGRYVVNEGDFGFNHYDGANDNYGTDALKRDHSNWEHYACAVDTTKEQTTDRVKLYFNGVYQSDLSTVVAINKNLDTFMNGTTVHFLGADGWTATPNSHAEILMSDVFFVDGQALTPDVFGFYKDGKGYISAGSTQATDFRPGQWVPKTPRVIKAQIERNGGFGVNGFYLPMNDNSNFGADFHTTPNSIITLKGEDLPQPQNGAPTTSDAYVSQLRTDANAANLVLAVPGISTATGANLVTNGTFDTNTTGWTAGNSGTLSVDAGRLKVTNGTSSAGYAYQEITVENGKRYTVNLEGITGTSASNVRVGTAENSAAYGNQIGSGLVNISFTTTSTSLYITLKPNSNTNGNNALFDNIVVKQEDVPRDYSADIKGSGTNKTVTANGQAGVGYELGNYYGSAMKFDGSGDYFSRTYDADFNFGTDDFTIEMWAQPKSVNSIDGLFSVSGGSGSNPKFVLHLDSGEPKAHFGHLPGSSNIYVNSGIGITADQWSHIAFERTGSTATWYVNGVATGITTTLSQDVTFTNQPLYIGYGGEGTFDSFDGYIQDLRVYDVAKYKGGFDVPKPYTPVGIGTWRAVSDCTANNFATWNSLDRARNTGTPTDGNLTTGDEAGNFAIRSTVGVSTGKWYWEFLISSGTITNHHGIVAMGRSMGGNYLGQTLDSWGMYDNNGNKRNNGSFESYGSSFSQYDVGIVALDRTNGKIWWGKNGTWFGSGDPSAGSNAGFSNINSVCGVGSTSIFVSPSQLQYNTCSYNFGQNPTFSGIATAGTYTDSNGKGLFKYEPPTDFLALCEDNLPTPAIADPGEHFKTVLYEGDNVSNGVGRRAVRGVGFKPDLIWIKCRDQTQNHVLYDSVRGLQSLTSNTTAVESTFDSQILGSYDEDGFTTSPNNDSNYNGQSFVAWCWKAGAGTTSTNTDGSIDSVVSVNQTAGFSIVSYQASNGSSIGHGLGKQPAFMIIKNRNAVGDWFVYHKNGNGGSDLGSDQGLNLNSSSVTFTSGSNTFITAKNSSTFTVGSSAIVQNGSDDFIAYCWAEIEGYSKFGSYVGNQDDDGPFVYCGFKPAFLLLKIASPAGQERDWHIYDSARNPTNPVGLNLRPSADYTDTDEPGIDFLSNGFKIRKDYVFSNYNTGTIIFAAFAESPFTTANAK